MNTALIEELERKGARTLELTAAQELRNAAAEIDKLRRALRPFADLAHDKMSFAMVTYMVDGDPERQTFERPQAQRWFNRAAELMRPNDRVEGPGAASSRTVPSHDGLCHTGEE